jgi:hypothetical protein
VAKEEEEEATTVSARRIGVPTHVIDQDRAPLIYADRVEMSVQYYDLKLKLQQIIRADQELGVVAREVATIAISPQHARTLAEMLARGVQQYEEAFGQINPLPIGIPKK